MPGFARFLGSEFCLGKVGIWVVRATTFQHASHLLGYLLLLATLRIEIGIWKAGLVGNIAD